MTFAERLRELREGKGLSQSELADKASLSQTGITKWELGKRVPGFDAVQALCKALGVPCTIFDDCEHKPTVSRGRGRPKADAPTPAPAPTKPAATPKRRKPKK